MDIPSAKRRKVEIEVFYSREWMYHPLVLSVKQEDVEFLLAEIKKYRKELPKIQVGGKQFWKMVLDLCSAELTRELLRVMEPQEELLEKMERYVETRREKMPYIKGIDEVLETLREYRENPSPSFDVEPLLERESHPKKELAPC